MPRYARPAPAADRGHADYEPARRQVRQPAYLKSSLHAERLAAEKAARAERRAAWKAQQPKG